MSRDPGEPQRIRPQGPDQKVTLKHRCQYSALWLLNLLASMLPTSVMRTIGAMVGGTFHAVDKRHRRIALINADIVFGDRMPEGEKRAMIKRGFQHFGIAMMETLAAKRITERNFLDYVEWSSLDQFYQGLKAGKGVILCSAHYGNWEIMNLALGYLKLPLSAMARPIDNPLVDRFVE